LVLVVGCVNVASLLLARAVKREREMAMRAALGAGRGRLVRQCLTECALLGVGGGTLGVGVAVIGLHPFVAWWPGGLPRAGDVTMDFRALLFALAVALVASLSVGLAPALRAGREAGRGGTRRGVRRAHRGLVGAEVGLALVLLAAAGMLGETMVRLTSLRLGIATDHVLTGRVALGAATLANVDGTRATWQAMLARLRAQPQVADAAMVDTVPLRQGNNPGNYWVGATAPPEAQQPTALLNSVSTDYFQTMGIPLIAGRQFDSRDRLGSAPAVVVDETLAAHAFPGRSPQAAVGQAIHIGLSDDPHTIVGVVGHVRYWGPAGDDESPVRDQVYYAFEQLPAQYVRRWSELMSVVVKTRGTPLSALNDVERTVASTGDAALYNPATMADLAHGALNQQRFLALLFAAFSGLALLLACLGVYGVQAFVTAQRVPEIGLRMALGAQRERVFWMVVKESLAMVGVGVVVGAAVTLVGAGQLEKLVPGMAAGVETGTVLTIAAMGLGMMAAAALAVVPVARRASRVAPMGALRAE
jgi:putative ABC transport system permease protein